MQGFAKATLCNTMIQRSPVLLSLLTFCYSAHCFIQPVSHGISTSSSATVRPGGGGLRMSAVVEEPKPYQIAFFSTCSYDRDFFEKVMATTSSVAICVTVSTAITIIAGIIR